MGVESEQRRMRKHLIEDRKPDIIMITITLKFRVFPRSTPVSNYQFTWRYAVTEDYQSRRQPSLKAARMTAEFRKVLPPYGALVTAIILYIPLPQVPSKGKKEKTSTQHPPLTLSPLSRTKNSPIPRLRTDPLADLPAHKIHRHPPAHLGAHPHAPAHATPPRHQQPQHLPHRPAGDVNLTFTSFYPPTTTNTTMRENAKPPLPRRAEREAEDMVRGRVERGSVKRAEVPVGVDGGGGRGPDSSGGEAVGGGDEVCAGVEEAEEGAVAVYGEGGGGGKGGCEGEEG